MNTPSKVTAEHLQHAAYLYIRQSSLHQVFENTESTERQYALRRRAVALGWAEDRIVVIDHDQGQSGASAIDREGFQRLVADVGLGKAGIVMGLEVSRLARNCADWHRLLEICGLTHTLILDEDGLYDPGHYNDRLLLGLKGTMSEAELHVLKARLVGGVLNKAQCGELKMPLPIGFIYDEEDRVILDPDQQVQQSLRIFFATFERVGSAWSTVQTFRREGWKFPKRGQAGSGDVAWQELTHAATLDTLHNPRYAGAFCFGRTRSWKDIDGKQHVQILPRDQWRFLKPDVHSALNVQDEIQSRHVIGAGCLRGESGDAHQIRSERPGPRLRRPARCPVSRTRPGGAPQKPPFPWDQGVHAPRQEGQTQGPTDPLSKTTTTQLRIAVILPGQRRAGIVGFLDTERQQWPHWLCRRWWRWGEWRSDEGCRRRCGGL